MIEHSLVEVDELLLDPTDKSELERSVRSVSGILK